jgi:hypothetical protein
MYLYLYHRKVEWGKQLGACKGLDNTGAFMFSKVPRINIVGVITQEGPEGRKYTT